MTCPVCSTTLVAKDRDGIEIDACPTCRGVWLDRGELEKLITRAAQPFTPQAFGTAPQGGTSFGPAAQGPTSHGTPSHGPGTHGTPLPGQSSYGTPSHGGGGYSQGGGSYGSGSGYSSGHSSRWPAADRYSTPW